MNPIFVLEFIEKSIKTNPKRIRETPAKNCPTEIIILHPTYGNCAEIFSFTVYDVRAL